MAIGDPKQEVQAVCDALDRLDPALLIQRVDQCAADLAEVHNWRIHDPKVKRRIFRIIDDFIEE